ncbi:kininogen-1, partial [Mastomys coucha]|uniref:kininogen-1 n=1 Tax=Mastomys coucha TaxID=35658 RepID=UPI00126180C3
MGMDTGNKKRVGVIALDQDGSETFYSFKYQIKEGNCSVQSGLDWQDCDFKNAEEAVVAGLNFEITYSIVQTNCSKERFSFLRGDCVSLPKGDGGECRGNAFVDMENTIADFSQTCNVKTGEKEPLPKNCPGCPRDIPVDSPELKEALDHSIVKLNAENNHTFYFKIDTVKKATSQVVAGTKYVIEFIARETKCSKESNTELTEDCEIKHLGTTMMRRPPGFSPFRSVSVQEFKVGTTDSYFIEGVVATTPPYDTEIHDDLIPDIHVQPDSLSFKLISDFPEATSHKCPGRPWRPASWKDPNTD